MEIPCGPSVFRRNLAQLCQVCGTSRGSGRSEACRCLSWGRRHRGYKAQMPRIRGIEDGILRNGLLTKKVVMNSEDTSLIEGLKIFGVCHRPNVKDGLEILWRHRIITAGCNKVCIWAAYCKMRRNAADGPHMRPPSCTKLSWVARNISNEPGPPAPVAHADVPRRCYTWTLRPPQKLSQGARD